MSCRTCFGILSYGVTEMLSISYFGDAVALAEGEAVLVPEAEAFGEADEVAVAEAEAVAVIS